MISIIDFLVSRGLGSGFGVTVQRVILFLIALIVLALLGRIVLLPIVNRLLESRDVDAHARRPLIRTTWFLLLFVSITVAFGVAGLGNFLTAFATIAAAATLAVGFALQDVMKNFVAGVFIYVDRPFRIGDWIEWNDHSGIVEDISFRMTRVRTFNNELLTVPNAELTNNVVKNPVAYETLRQQFTFGIGYGDDIQHASTIIVEEAETHPEIIDDPAPSVRLTELGDSDIGLQSRFWIANPNRSDVVRIRGEYIAAVKEHFDACGIDIPYPIRTLEGGMKIETSGVP